MKYYDEMANLQVFSKEEINRTVGNSNAEKMILKNYVRSGLIQKIKFNYYATYSIENHQPIASRFVIGSNFNDKAYISHHSAFEYYGLHNQVFNIVYVSSGRSFKEFEYDRQFMYQKTGYILSMFKDRFSLSPAFFVKCKEQMGKSKRYLYNELKLKKNVYDEEWQLVTRLDAMGLLDV